MQIVHLRMNMWEKHFFELDFIESKGQFTSHEECTACENTWMFSVATGALKTPWTAANRLCLWKETTTGQSNVMKKAVRLLHLVLKKELSIFTYAIL